MQTSTQTIEQLAKQDYKFGLVTDGEQESPPPGLDEDVVRLISEKKEEPEWMLDWRLRAYRHWLTMSEPRWANIHYGPIDYQTIVYYAAPKANAKGSPKSLDELDAQILKTYEKLRIPLRELELLAGSAVDAVFASVSVVLTFYPKLGDLALLFCAV